MSGCRLLQLECSSELNSDEIPKLSDLHVFRPACINMDFRCIPPPPMCSSFLPTLGIRVDKPEDVLSFLDDNEGVTDTRGGVAKSRRTALLAYLIEKCVRQLAALPLPHPPSPPRQHQCDLSADMNGNFFEEHDMDRGGEGDGGWAVADSGCLEARGWAACIRHIFAYAMQPSTCSASSSNTFSVEKVMSFTTRNPEKSRQSPVQVIQVGDQGSSMS